MRKHFFFAAAAVLALCFASCQKEEETVVLKGFTAGMERSADSQNGKTQLVDNYFNWVSGETVTVFSGSNSMEYTATPHTDDATWADFVPAGGSDGLVGSSFTAISPSTIAVASNKISLSQYQSTPDGNLAGFPMIAQSNPTDPTKFQPFKNLCGVLKVHLETDATFDLLYVEADDNIAGTFNIVNNNGYPELEYCENGSNSVGVFLPSSIDFSEGGDLYVALPPSGQNGYKLKLTFAKAFTDLVCVKNCTRRVVVERSKITNITIGGDLDFLPYGALSGVFSVSATKQVHFAKGNLVQNQGEWEFFDDQWASASDPTTDHFAWSSTDYGTNMGSAWSTLSHDEWDYLIGNSATFRTDAANKRGVGRIDMGGGTYVNGFIILPDSWNCPSGLSFTATNFFSGNYSTNTFTLDDWSTMEIAGAVFLPSTGYYDSGRESLRNTTYGNYLCSDDYYLNFDNDGIGQTVRSCPANHSMNVRLVCE